jgi:predicted secreted protein
MNQIIEPNFEGEEMKIPTGMATPSTEPSAPSVVSAPVLVLLTIVLIAIFAGLGYWYYLVMNTPIIDSMPLRPTPEMNNEPESTTAEARTATMDVVSTSDELDAIEADVESTNLDDLDAELTAIDAELNAALSASF